MLGRAGLLGLKPKRGAPRRPYRAPGQAGPSARACTRRFTTGGELPQSAVQLGELLYPASARRGKQASYLCLLRKVFAEVAQSLEFGPALVTFTRFQIDLGQSQPQGRGVDG